MTGVDATSEAIAGIQAEGAFLATVEQPWPSILDSVLEHVLAYQEDGTCPTRTSRRSRPRWSTRPTRRTSPRRTSSSSSSTSVRGRAILAPA